MTISHWLLCYWIRGQPLHGWGTIEVPPSTSIDALRSLLITHESVVLSAHSRSSICIYKVPEASPIPDDDSLEGLLGSLSISNLGKPLRATRELSSLFVPPLPKSQLHLIIDVPPLVNCWLRGTERASSFMVRSSKLDRVDLLKRAIREEQFPATDTPASRLKLYKISTSDDELTESLGETGAGQLLGGDQLLEMVFRDVPFSKTPRVVAEWLDEKTSRPPPSAHRFIGHGNPITEARKAFLVHTAKDKPSSSGTPSSFRTRQNSHKLIPCGRPRDLERDCEDTIPPTLLHSVFGQFVDDCQSIEIKTKDNRLAEDLEIAMSRLYDNESQRVEGVNEVLKHYQIHLIISKIQKTDYLVDGAISLNGHRYVIAEFKNEAGNTSAEPYFEAIAYYLESTREDAPKHPSSPLPCLLLAIFGPYIVFAGAAWNLRPTVQILSTPIAFHFHSTDTQNHLTVARHLAALRRALDSLDEYYRALETPLSTATDIPPQPQLFPHKTSYKSLDNDTIKTFQYEREVVEKKLIFFGTEADTREWICIKFSRTYSRAAHEYLASLGCAPVLRGHERVPGGWIMVVFDALSEFETLADRKQPLPLSVFDNISETLHKLHKAGFVHGDFRDVNIMVSKTDEKKYMIIDFDWAGRIGEARYPACVNTQSITRPGDELDGKLILEAHDVFMLNQLARRKFED